MQTRSAASQRNGIETDEFIIAALQRPENPPVFHPLWLPLRALNLAPWSAQFLDVAVVLRALARFFQKNLSKLLAPAGKITFLSGDSQSWPMATLLLVLPSLFRMPMKPSIRRRRSARPKITFEKLEERKLLATLDILAAGTSGTERINLYVDSQIVATFDDLGTGAYSNRFNTLSYQSEEAISAGDVRIEFVNDAYTPIYRDVQIDAIVIDGQRFEAESPDVFSTCLLYTSPSPRDRG